MRQLWVEWSNKMLLCMIINLWYAMTAPLHRSVTCLGEGVYHCHCFKIFTFTEAFPHTLSTHFVSSALQRINLHFSCLLSCYFTNPSFQRTFEDPNLQSFKKTGSPPGFNFQGYCRCRAQTTIDVSRSRCSLGKWDGGQFIRYNLITTWQKRLSLLASFCRRLRSLPASSAAEASCSVLQGA